jgi:hypothetical protein
MYRSYLYLSNLYLIALYLMLISLAYLYPISLLCREPSVLVTLLISNVLEHYKHYRL